MSRRNVKGGLALGLCLAAVASAQPAPVRFDAVAINISNVGRSGLGTLDIRIDRWTTPEELGTLRDALLEKGSDGLLRAMQDVKKVGSIRSTSGGLGWDIQFAQWTELPGGGHRVVFATDRPMSLAERVNQPRTADYEFLAAEMRIGPDGKGEGKLVPMAKITYNKGSRAIEVENYANEPVRLTKVTEKREGL